MGKRKKALVTLMLCVLIMCNLTQLKIEAKNGEIINNTNGLISAGVNDVCQTTDGFLWIAQYEGLTKFDGSDYQLINSIKIKGKNIRLEQITNVESDSDNCLFIGTKNYGMILYKNGVYTAVSSKRGSNVNDICVCDNVVYVATTEGAYMYYADNTVKWLEDTVGNPVISISAKGSDIYYVADSGTVYLYNGKSAPFYTNESVKIVRVIDNHVYFGSYTGTLICRDTNKAAKYIVSKDDPINELYMRQGVLIIGTDKGVFMLKDNKTSRIKELEKYSGINHILFDYEGGMWMATTVGLVELHRFGSKNLFPSYNLEESLTNACIYYKNKLYAGMDNGLVIIDEKKGCAVSNKLTRMLQEIRVRDFAIYNEKLYIATYSSDNYDVLVFDGKTVNNISASKMLGNNNPENVSDHGQIRCFANYKDGLLIGTNYGITLLRNNKFQTIKMVFRPLSIMVGSSIYACSDGNGIYTVDFEKKTTKTLSGTEGQTILRTIELDNRLIFAVGTCLYYQNGNKLVRIKSPNVGSIVDLIELPHEIAILTGSGMLLVEKSTIFNDKIKVNKKLNSATGLESGVTANGRACYVNQSETIYLNCQNGVYTYSKKAGASDIAAPRLAITNISVDNTDVLPQDTITVSGHAQRIGIDLAVLTFMDRESLTVYYQLEGVDEKPLKLDINRANSLEYMNLRGGKYTLRMYAVNGSGVKSKELTLTIDKTLKWIEKPVHIVVVVVFDILVIVGIILLLLRRRIKKEHAKMEWSKRVTEESLEAIANAIDAKDAYTNGHSIRVAKLSQCIGKHMKMSSDNLETLYYIGLMHDVGKIGIPDGILNKPGKLTNDEYEIMKSHPSIGYSILKTIHSIPHLEDGVLYHHEKCNGSGYPKNLKRDEIPLTGKIIACADAFDAMATRRCYKDKMSDESIISEFERCSGTHFDPELVSIVIECIKNGEFDAIIAKWYEDTNNSQKD